MEQLTQAIQEAQSWVNQLIEFEPSKDENELHVLKKKVDLKLTRLADIYSDVGAPAKAQVLALFKNDHELWIILEFADRCISRMHVGNIARLANSFFFAIAVQNLNTDPREISKRLSQVFQIIEQSELSVKTSLKGILLKWLHLATPEAKQLLDEWFQHRSDLGPA